MVESEDILAKKFMKKLESSLSPFEKFVAKIDIEETLPLVIDRQSIIDHITSALDFTDPTQIFPISANTGAGKTYLLWQIKKSMSVSSQPIFMSVPVSPKLFYYGLYTKIIETIGSSNLREVTARIVDAWGADKRKYGIFRTANSEKILAQALESDLYQTSKHQPQLEEVIKVIITHSLDPEKSYVAERWLLGEVMDYDDLLFIGVENNLATEYMAEELLKIMLSNIDEGIILMFDDLDKNWKRFNDEDNGYSIDEDWSSIQPSLSQPSLENGTIPPAGQGNTIFSELANLIENNKSIKVIFTLHVENQEKLLQAFPTRIAPRIHESFLVPNYSLEGSLQYYLDAVAIYRKKHQLDAVPSNQFFPLTKELIIKIHEYTKGNPREVIRAFQKMFDALVFDEWSVARLEADFVKLLR